MEELELMLALFKLSKLYGNREYTIKNLSEELGLNPKTGFVYREKIFSNLIEKGILVESRRKRWKFYKIDVKKLIKEIIEHPTTKIIMDVIAEY